MKMDVRTSVALCLFIAATTAAAQNANPEQTVPAPQQAAPPSPPPPPAPPPAQSAPQVQATPLPPQNPQPAPPPPQVQPPPPAQQAQPTQPATPPPPRLPSRQYQYTPPPQSPPPPQYKYQYAPPPASQSSPPPPPSPPAKPQWAHSESSYPGAFSGFQYHPFRFHIDGGGTLTQRSNDTLLDNGWNAGLGLSWYPTRHLPLGIRVDGTYNEFDARPGLLDRATVAYGTRVDNGTHKMWGGDVDLELDLHLSPYVRAYFLAGGGWYKVQDTFRHTDFYAGYICFWWGCGPGYYGVDSIVARNTSHWTFAKNAGFGLEFALAPRTSFFVEARYMRLNPNDAKSDFIPIKAGLRF